MKTNFFLKSSSCKRCFSEELSFLFIIFCRKSKYYIIIKVATEPSCSMKFGTHEMAFPINFYFVENEICIFTEKYILKAGLSIKYCIGEI